MVPLSCSRSLADYPGKRRRPVASAIRLILARHVEALGYRRYWMAGTSWQPSRDRKRGDGGGARPYIAAGTNHIRIGAGGIMLPNHAPLLIAEQFGTLAALHPGRVDLGLGRAPGVRSGHRARGCGRTLHSERGRLPRRTSSSSWGSLPGCRTGPGGAGGSRRRAGRADLDQLGQAPTAHSSRPSSAPPFAFASHFALRNDDRSAVDLIVPEISSIRANSQAPM